MQLIINFLLAIYVVVALLMLLVILMQRPRSEGLGAAFGGGVTENIFGAQTTNVLVKITAWLAAIFFSLTFVLSVLYAHKATGRDSGLRNELIRQQAGTAATASPGASAAPATSAGSPASSVSPSAAPKTNAAPATTSAAPSASAKPSPR